ncbi:MAG: hypothetical protein WD823_06125 [Sulfuricaulis sp.]|uniref:RND transporter n=1 Tax=Sulfuricaulis sp. TaxID=2003553 RepID=UPI0034A4F537
MSWLDKIPMTAMIVAALVLGLAPFVPEPHLWQKLKMLANGTLSRPIDIFDLIMHASVPILVGVKLFRGERSGKNKRRSS